jgi:hypothetical protein
VAGALFLAAFEAKCFLGALAPVDFLAVYLVLAIFIFLIFFVYKNLMIVFYLFHFPNLEIHLIFQIILIF